MKEVKYVGFWQRLVMSIFDMMILSGTIFLVSLLFHINLPSTEYIRHFLRVVARIIPFIPILYTLIFWRIKGGTPGKLFRRVKIADAKTGEIPSIWKLIVRFFCYPVSFTLLLLGFFWIGLDSRKQAWHDKIAGTVVVKPEIRKVSEPGEDDPLSKDEKSIFPTNPTKRDTKRWNLGKALFVISVIVFLFTSHILNHDDKLIEDAGSWLYEPALIEDNPEDNGYYYLVGIDVPEEKDNFEIGYERVNAQNDYILKHAKYPSTERVKITYNEILSEKDHKNMIDSFEKDSLFAYCLENREKIINQYSELSYINERFISALDHKYFITSVIPHYTDGIPFFFLEFFKYKLLETYYIATLYSSGDKQEALYILNQSIKYSRMLIESADYLTLKILALNLLKRNLHTYDQILNYENESNQLLKEGVLKIQPIQVFERDLTKVAKRLFVEKTGFILDIYNFHQNLYIRRNYYIPESFVKNSKFLFFKPHKTINQEYITQKHFADLSKVNGKEFSELEKEPYVSVSSHFDYISNRYGLAFVSFPNLYFHRYIAKFHDFDGYINILKLKVLIKEQNIEPAQIPDFLEAHCDSLCNPYTEEAMKWDADKSTIYFDGPYEDTDTIREIKVK
ncbi:MAG: RDD family protein [Candidatus Cloacimonetes bacterium]|nr:RDD family protein [Candidatus Cloacimonadota bacterium]